MFYVEVMLSSYEITLKCLSIDFPGRDVLCRVYVV
jgi:hypothetical protein